MSNKRLDELISELLVIKDLYICGRMNQSICLAVVSTGHREKFSQTSWSEYEDLSSTYINDSLKELFERRDEIMQEASKCGPVSIDIVLNTSYKEFDEDLINDMMVDFYGDKDSIAFASSYNYFAEDFNAFLQEFSAEYKEVI